jgi:two-component system response regulator PilR (NtrC family)
VLERAVALAPGETIEAADLQLRPLPGPAAAAATAPAAPAREEPSSEEEPGEFPEGGLGSQLEGVEREAILRALEKTRYNKTAAARLLGMSFRALRYRIKKLGIE